jgi:hypothetical protein
VRGAATESAGVRVEDAVDPLAAVIEDVFRIPFLQRRVGGVADEEIPAQRVVFRGESVERRDVVVVGQEVDARS